MDFLNPADLIVVENGRLLTTTRKVAQVFEKRHDNVLRITRKRIAAAGAWGVLNFEETPYIDPQNGQAYAEYTMTKDGFTFLVQKFDGEKAVRFQIAYIEAFNAMADYIANRERTLWNEMLEVERLDGASFERASFGSRLMLDRKAALPELEQRRLRIRYDMQMEFDFGQEDKDE